MKTKILLLAVLATALPADTPKPDKPLICPICYNFTRNEKFYFEDLFVIETVTRRQISVSEMLDMIDKLPNVKSVSIGTSGHPRRVFDLSNLAYPQYRDNYQLTQDEWKALQLFCAKRLEDSAFAHPDVIAHWKSIVAGNPPFGLKVQSP